MRNHTIHLKYDKTYYHLKEKGMNLTDDTGQCYTYTTMNK